MSMVHDLHETLVPVLVFAIPIIAIVGGISSRIVRTMARARIQELLIQERIRAMEKGLTPPDLPAMDRDSLGITEFDREHWQHRAFGLRLAGSLVLAIGGAIMFALWQTGERDGFVWMSVFAAIGLVLLIASFFVPGRGAGPPSGPRS